jgi:F-type H+-transporting ATPase subunit b
MLATAEFWVAVSFVIFLGLIVYLEVPGKVASALDARAERIGKELADAQRLREEALALLADYERKREEAEKEAQDIIAQARTEAEEYAAETRRKLAETIERRTLHAEQKIAQAEAQAMKEVRAAATDLAIAAASRIIAEEIKGEKAAKLVDQTISALKDKLH